MSNSITAVVVGGLLILAYTKTIAKKGSLDRSDPRMKPGLSICAVRPVGKAFLMNS